MSEIDLTRFNPETYTSPPWVRSRPTRLNPDLTPRHASADVANYVRQASAEAISNEILPAGENMVLRLYARVKEYCYNCTRICTLLEIPSFFLRKLSARNHARELSRSVLSFA